MAEAVLGVVNVIVDKTLPLVADKISRAWGVKEDLKKLSEKVEMMKALISDAQNKQLITSEAVQVWLQKLLSVAREAEIVLDDFGYELLRQKIENRKRDKVHSFFSSSNPLSFRLEMSSRIKNVTSSLEEAYREANQIGLHPVGLTITAPDHKEDRITDPFVDVSEIVGREDEVSKVVSMLMKSDYKDLPVISIVGMGGQGKTTLAQVVLKNGDIVKYFDVRIWVCVSDDFKVERLLNEMLQSLEERNAETTNREELVRRLQERMKGKRCLLVLDDIWNENREKWDCMRKCLLEIGASQGSKILATARSHVVASVMLSPSSHELRFLSDDHSCILFEKIAFANGGARKTPKLEDIGRRILKRCGGVPLAIKAIGGLLYSMKDELEWSMIEKSEIWSTADGVFSALKLSYEHLPSLSLKQCFASCSIFSKDTRMEKEELIQIWMAQGLINHSKGGGHLQMEGIGSNYFNILMRSSLLQDPKRDEYNNIVSCKMHDLVHDFSLKMSNNYLFDTEDGLVINNDEEVVHLNLILHEGKMLKNVGSIPPKLRTLYLEVENYAVLEDLLKRFKYLYVLKVARYNVTHLPNAVGEMKHLRHLDISQTNIATLPDYITKLYNLMTLRCSYHLKNIPKGFVNLINFKDFSCPAKYFQNKHIYCLPGIGQLSNLQRWPLFAVSQDKGCQIEELGRLHNLKGEIRICGLENVSSYESATKANLFGKSSIQSLELAWDHKTEEDGEDNIDVLEGLQPHSNLKGLTIVEFKGSKFPSWMVDLRNLVKIELNLLACEQVTSLGHLPCLQILRMSGLGNVKRIGIEFYGREILDSSRSSSSCSSEGAPITLFPALRSLALLFMDSLVECSHDGMMISSDSSKVFTNLRDLYLHNLPKLAILPDMCSLTCLHQLNIQSCKSLSRSRNLNSLASLKSLHITDCPNLDETFNMDKPQSINLLHLSGCDKLIPSLSSLDNFTSLKYLIIESYAEFWPKDLHHPPNLWKLVLGALYNKDRHDFDFFPWPFSSTNVATTRKDGQQHFMPLRELKLIGWPKIKSFPEQIQHLSALTSLYILRFDGLKALPEWLGNFRNLEYLRVESCSNLEQLHSVEAMQRLTNLRRLDINYCPRLSARCTRGSGAEWPKIAHIPHLFIMYLCVSFHLFLQLPEHCKSFVDLGVRINFVLSFSMIFSWL